MMNWVLWRPGGRAAFAKAMAAMASLTTT